VDECKSLMGGGELDASDIGIITPYAAQVRALRSARSSMLGVGPELEIASVDGFQGREKEAIVFSAVRASSSGRGATLLHSSASYLILSRFRDSKYILDTP
jgi:hypothetical protein